MKCPLNILMFAVSLLGISDGHARTAVPIEALAHVPKIQSVSMSADGRNVVALVAGNDATSDESVLATWSMEDLDAGPILTASGDRMKFIAASALKANRIVVFARQEWTGRLGSCGEGRSVGATKTFVSKAYLTDIKHKKFQEAFTSNARSIGISEEMQRCLELTGRANLVSALPLDPENVIVSQLNEATLSSQFFLYNLKTDETKPLFRATGRSTPGLFNPRNGELLTRVELEPVTGRGFEQRILIRKAGSDEFEVHEGLTRNLADRYTVDIVGIDEATGKYYVLTDLFSDRVEARVYDAVARKFDDAPLVAHPKYSISRLVLGTQPKDFNQVIGFVVAAMEPELIYVDAELGSIQATLKQNFKNQTVTITGYNNDRSRVLFSTESARHAPSYHILLDRKRVVTLGQERPSVNPEDIGEQRWVTYPARDGRQIPAILDLPSGWSADQGPLPTIIHPHGGPWARDWGGWDASGWVPFLTSRGYAVLRPQYRGSSGLGRSHWLAGDGEWGQKMQDDKDDGAAWLVKEGIADADRLIIFGYSYGGFAAAAAAVRPDSPYRCAIAGAPVTDLARLGNSWSDNRVQRILQGRTVTGMDPMKHTDKVNIPVLLYVGDRDVRTPAFHAKSFYEAVKGRVTARFELIPDMPHSMPWYPRHSVKSLSLMEEFLSGPCVKAVSKR